MTTGSHDSILFLLYLISIIIVDPPYVSLYLHLVFAFYELFIPNVCIFIFDLILDLILIVLLTVTYWYWLMVGNHLHVPSYCSSSNMVDSYHACFYELTYCLLPVPFYELYVVRSHSPTRFISSLLDILPIAHDSLQSLPIFLYVVRYGMHCNLLSTSYLSLPHHSGSILFTLLPCILPSGALVPCTIPFGCLQSWS